MRKLPEMVKLELAKILYKIKIFFTDETDFSVSEKHNYEGTSNSDHGECSGNSSFYRKVKYRYRGQRSEGNRYIKNVQL